MSVRVVHDTRGSFRSYGNVTERPCPAILVGPNAMNSCHYQVLTDDAPERPPRAAEDKPEYRVPPMEEIRALPWNGLKMVSLFSGCGGSCLGFRMAGFRVLWASEFIEAARETYSANHVTPVDPRDIRTVTPEEILTATGLKSGELDVLEGSPPCASFSTAGKREKGWGKVKQYSDGAQRSDDLFFEYARILRGLMPRAFVAENVSGLVKGTAKGYFLNILQELKASGYRVKAKLLDAQWLGVPQTRQRIIFIGVRNDLGRDPVHPGPLPYRYSVRDALPWITRHEYMGPGHTPMWAPGEKPAYCVSQMGNFSKKQSPFTLVEAESDISGYAIAKEWDRLQMGEHSDKYLNLAKSHTERPVRTVSAIGGSSGAAAVTHPTERRKFTIAELRRICGFPDDFVLTGTYAQQWERLGRAVPPVMMCAIASSVRDLLLAV